MSINRRKEKENMVNINSTALFSHKNAWIFVIATT
jgi:hypothetical protein